MRGPVSRVIPLSRQTAVRGLAQAFGGDGRTQDLAGDSFEGKAIAGLDVDIGVKGEPVNRDASVAADAIGWIARYLDDPLDARAKSDSVSQVASAGSSAPIGISVDAGS